MWGSNGCPNERGSTQRRRSLTSSPCCTVQERCSQQAWKVIDSQALLGANALCRISHKWQLDTPSTSEKYVLSYGSSILNILLVNFIQVGLVLSYESTEIACIPSTEMHVQCQYAKVKLYSSPKKSHHVLNVSLSSLGNLLPFGLKTMDHQWI